MVKEEKCALPPCPGLLEDKELTVVDLSFILFNINYVKFKIPYTASSAKSYTCRAQISNSLFFLL